VGQQEWARDQSGSVEAQAEGPAVNRSRANGPCQATGRRDAVMKQILALSRARKSYDGKVVL